MDIKTVLDSGHVVRYHCAPIDQKQSNSSHQWEVAVILTQIYPQVSAQLLTFALTHDVAEMVTGDMPSPIKKEVPELKAILDELEEDYRQDLGLQSEEHFSEEELLAVKYADILSGIYFTTHRVNCGDKGAVPIRDNWLKYYGSLPHLNSRPDNILEAILK